MSVFKKYDYWSILESLDTMTEYDYNGNVNDSIYYDFYQEQITELCVIAADMYNELDGIKSKLWYEMPEKHIEFVMKILAHKPLLLGGIPQLVCCQI